MVSLVKALSLDQKRKQLVNDLKHQGYIHSPPVEQAFLFIPRECFIPRSLKQQAYMDTPLCIGKGQTISAPHMVAIMCEALQLQPGLKILEIGAGSGYHSAIVSHSIGTSGHVYSVERFEDLATQAKANLKECNISNVSIHIRDGSQGLEEHAPYDRIYVTCAAPKVPPPLLDQLKEKGKLLIPVGRYRSNLELYEKKKNSLQKKELSSCVFVPLIGKYGFEK